MIEIQDVQGVSPSSALSGQPAISAEALRFSYSRAQQPVINIPQWRVGAGERVFLHGASGMGKSTLLQLLNGQLIGTGHLSVAGEELSQLSTSERNRFRALNIGTVFQQFNLIPYLSSLDNVALAAMLAGQSRVESTALARSLLNDTWLAPNLWCQRAEALSIGQQQRVAIARALINAPQILLFDEPTSALDETHRNLFMQVLIRHLDRHQHTTTIFVSHDTRLTSYFDKSVCLQDLALDFVEGEIKNAD